MRSDARPVPAADTGNRGDILHNNRPPADDRRPLLEEGRPPAMLPMPLASCLYVGRVQHRRLVPFEHVFQYSLYQVYLDLDELETVFAGRWFWSTRGPNAAWFRRSDHLGPAHIPLSEAVRDLVESRLGQRPRGPIRLLTNLRHLGYVINPVSFYYCFDQTGQHIQAFVAEVQNTPWGERHCYVLEWPATSANVLRVEHAKEFHVSPFLEMNHSYCWLATAPSEQLSIHIENHQAGQPVFTATLSMQRRPITTSTLAGVLTRFPVMTAQVLAGIYWQALRLWWRGATYVPHPGPSASSAR